MLPRPEPDSMYSLLLPLLLAVNLSKTDPVAARIDEFMARHWQTADVQPALLADDTTFLRRITLDLASRIPSVQEAKSFFADTAADKRTTAIKRLMDSPEY